MHTTKFSPGAGTQILTTSSDTTVRLFDLSTSAQLRSFRSHTDYVRTAAFVPTSPSLVFSGGYDGTVRLWDARVKERGGEVWLGRHGKPVEDVIVGQEGTMAVSAGGPIVRVWDLLGAASSSRVVNAGGEGEDGEGQDEGETENTGTQYCVKALSNHQKTIMSLCWAEGENGEKRMLSGGLDGLVKVYDPQDNWRVRHTMRYGGQVLSVAVSVRCGVLVLVVRGLIRSTVARPQPNSSHLIAGLSDGSLSIRTRQGAKKTGLSKEFVVPSYDALLAGAGSGGVTFTGAEAMEGLKGAEAAANAASGTGEQKIGRERKRKLQEWDRMLKDFRYGDALDSVMRKVWPDRSSTAFPMLIAVRAHAGRHTLNDLCPARRAHPPRRSANSTGEPT